MEEFRRSPAEINNIDYLNKKRKLQNEHIEMPLPKHICWSQNANFDSSSNSSTEPNKTESEIFAGGNELNQESAEGSNSFHSNEDSIMSNEDESNTFSGYREICPSDEPSTSSVSWGSSSAETTSLNKSLSTSDCFDHPDFDGSFSEYRNYGIEQFMDKELENLIYSNRMGSSEFVLSSGRWSVNQDNQRESKKLTIDKEFEEYFSMLML